MNKFMAIVSLAALVSANAAFAGGLDVIRVEPPVAVVKAASSSSAGSPGIAAAIGAVVLAAAVIGLAQSSGSHGSNN